VACELVGEIFPAVLLKLAGEPLALELVAKLGEARVLEFADEVKIGHWSSCLVEVVRRATTWRWCSSQNCEPALGELLQPDQCVHADGTSKPPAREGTSRGVRLYDPSDIA
jgi:hypothetical protein